MPTPSASSPCGSRASSPSRTFRELFRASSPASRNNDARESLRASTPLESRPQSRLSTSVAQKYTAEERLNYIRSLRVLQPGEQPLFRFIAGALAQAPLPVPWRMHRDQSGRVFFANRATGKSSWSHPLETPLRELVPVCRMMFEMGPEERQASVSKFARQWECEAKHDISNWYAVKHDSGKEYFVHRETGESMWAHPAEVFMPFHYIKIQAIERLRHAEYFESLLAANNMERYRIDASVSPAAESRPATGFEFAPPRAQVAEFRRDEGEITLSSTAGSLHAYMNSPVNAGEFSHSLADIHGTGTGSSPIGSKSSSIAEAQSLRAVEDRAKELTQQLAKERERADTLLRDRDHNIAQAVALATAQACKAAFSGSTLPGRDDTADDQARAVLEIRLAAYSDDARDLEKVLALYSREVHPVLEGAYRKEQERVVLRDNLLRASARNAALQEAATRERRDVPLPHGYPASASAASEHIRKDLEERLRRTTASEESLRAELAAVRKQLIEATDKMSISCTSPDDPMHEELVTQLREAHAVQASLRERLASAVSHIQRAQSDDGSGGRERVVRVEAQLVETRRKFDQMFEVLQDAEKQKGVAEARAVRAEALLAQERSAAEAARKSAALSLPTDAVTGASPAAMVPVEKIRRAEAVAAAANERATIAETRLAKERIALKALWDCVEQAEAAKEALEERLARMEQGFTDCCNLHAPAKVECGSFANKENEKRTQLPQITT